MNAMLEADGMEKKGQKKTVQGTVGSTIFLSCAVGG